VSPSHPKLTLISISGSRNGRHYDDDIVFQRETNGRRQLDGVHRGRGREEEEEVRSSALIINDTRDRGRRFEAQTSSRDRMWTEITRDLVSEEAIKEKGYEFEETPEFYYVMKYLRYVSSPSFPPPQIHPPHPPKPPTIPNHPRLLKQAKQS